jgi:hypothetical protein
LYREIKNGFAERLCVLVFGSIFYDNRNDGVSRETAAAAATTARNGDRYRKRGGDGSRSRFEDAATGA